MKRTPLYQAHLSYKGKMVEFSGWELPVFYKDYGIIKEHQNVREKVGLFDVSHMGEIMIEGKGATPFVDWLLPNDVKGLHVNQACYTPMCKEDGGIVDDLLVYKIAEDKLLLVVNAANVEKDFAWISKKLEEKKFDCEARNLSSEYVQLALQGPLAPFVLAEISDVDPDGINYYWFTFGKIGDVEALISRTGYTGEDGFEFYFTDIDKAVNIWNLIMEKGEKYGIAPAGLGARDSLRLEAKLLLYGNEMDESVTPVEARLMWTVKKDKEDFCGKDAILKRKKEGAQKYLAGFEVEGKGIPRHGYAIFNQDGERVGEVTSGLKSPTLGKSIGLAYLKKGFHKVGTELVLEIRGKKHPIKVVKTPFYKKPPIKKINTEDN